MKTLLLFLSLVTASFAAPSTPTFKDYRASLLAFEGYRTSPYRDTDGGWVVGIGHALRSQAVKSHYSSWEIEQFFTHDLAVSIEAARAFLPGFDGYPLDVRMVVITLAFSCGPTGLMRFHNLQIALRHHSYVLAANELGHSKWFNQVSWKRANWAWGVLKGQP